MSNLNEEGIPLIVGKENGGEYVEESFLAGMLQARLDIALIAEPVRYENWYPTALIPQVDLSAMHFGYSIECTECEDHPQWSYIVLEKLETPFEED